jgi:hypothetical protein
MLPRYRVGAPNKRAGPFLIVDRMLGRQTVIPGSSFKAHDDSDKIESSCPSTPL